MVAMVALTLLIGIARGVQKDLAGQVDDLGVNLLIVLPGRIDPNQMNMNPNLGGQSYLKPSHAAEIRKLPGVRQTAMLTFAGGGVRFQKQSAFPINIAAEPSWFSMRETELQEGRVFTESDIATRVCVLGGIAKKALFADESALDKQVEINGEQYRVIGVTKNKDDQDSLFSMGGFENVAYVPFQVFQAANQRAQIDRIMIQFDSAVEPTQLVKGVESELSKSLDSQQFSVLTQKDLLKLVYKLMSILTWLLTGLTSIALFVGGVGIMAIMMMAASERTKEIGIRKTVGALKRDVFQQFLCEAVIVSLFGGILGLIISLITSSLLTRFTVIKPEITFGLIAFALGVCVLLGAVFGIVPALKAATKDPVVAIRLE